MILYRIYRLRSKYVVCYTIDIYVFIKKGILLTMECRMLDVLSLTLFGRDVLNRSSVFKVQYLICFVTFSNEIVIFDISAVSVFVCCV